MTLLEAAKRAREALGPTAPECCGCAVEWEIAITALDQAIAEAEKQKPVACSMCNEWEKVCEQHLRHIKKLKKQRRWQGLTDEEMHECWGDPLTPLGMKCARAIEAKLKEKNT